MDLSNISIIAGDYNQKELNTRFNTEDDIYNNIAEFVMLYDTSDYPIMDKDDVIKDGIAYICSADHHFSQTFFKAHNPL